MLHFDCVNQIISANNFFSIFYHLFVTFFDLKDFIFLVFVLSS